MHARLDLEVHFADQLVAVGTVNWDVLEDDVIRENDFSTLSGMLNLGQSFACGLLNILRGFLSDHDALVSAIGEIIEHFFHLVNERGVTSQVLHFLVRDNEATDGLGKVDQKGRVANVVLRDLSLIIAELGEVLTTLRSEHWQADDSITDHDSAVLDKHGVIDTHQEALFENEADVRVKFVEATIDVTALPDVSIVEGNLF